MELKFGTGGVRAVMGEGKNRMNKKTVELLSLGTAEYLKKKKGTGVVAICYDTRNYSGEFAKITADVFRKQGFQVYLAKKPTPTPLLSYYIRKLKADLGVNITASHNPKEYNGYKVYNEDGCQIGEKEAAKIQKEISRCFQSEENSKCFKEKEAGRHFEEKGNSGYFKKKENSKCLNKEENTGCFKEMKTKAYSCRKEQELNEKKEEELCLIPQSLWKNYKEEIKQYLKPGFQNRKKISVVYTPLHGTGEGFLPELLQETGVTDLILVEEQRKADGNFPTCPVPNPEEPEALKTGLEYCKKYKADLLLATDPDSDRIGVAARDGKEYNILNGNQVGVLLLEYILNTRKKQGNLPQNPVLIKTIVTTSLADKIAKACGVTITETLTGFKYIGEKIKEMERNGREKDFLFGMEESCGYLIGTYARDKDALSAACLICEIAEEEKQKGGTLWDRWNRLVKEYGLCENSLETISYTKEEAELFMKQLRADLRRWERNSGSSHAFTRADEVRFEGKKIIKAMDYKKESVSETESAGLPRADVIRLWLSDGEQVTIRPSGTEPKIKFYRERWN